MTAPDPAPASPATGPAPVLDVEAGVARLMGNRTIYLRVLARFLKDYRNAGTALRQALAAADSARAERLAHTLKGAAGMIEAAALHTAAMTLEGALRTGTGKLDDLLQGVDDALGAVLHELDRMQLSEAAGAPHQDAGPEPRQRLRTLLATGDGTAVELVKGARHALREALGEPAYGALSAAVADFDYERALAILDQPERAGI